MAVIKANVQDNFVVVTNDVAQKSELSLEARGMILLMGSRPQGWKFNKAELMENAGIGRDKLNRIFKELINWGHLAVVQNHDKEGKFVDADYHFFTNSEQNPAFINLPRTDLPYTDEPCNGESAPIKERVSTKERSLQNEQINLLKIGFENFWQNWHNKKEKQRAKKVFERIGTAKIKKSEDDFKSFVEQITFYATERMEYIEKMKRDDPYYFDDGFPNIHPATYLKNSRWEDEYK